jgi:pSer/pThr/pTyr-binding forkhead associated (FHA) protein
MLSLVVSLRGRVIDRRSFSDDKRVRVGRTPDNELQIDNPLFSRTHFLIERAGRGVYRLRDLGSQNGTYVNGERVKERNLNDGDVVAVGKFVFTVEIERARASSGPIGEVDPGVTFNLGGTIVSSQDSGGRQEGRASILAHLVVGELPLVLDQDVCLIGGWADCDLKVPGFLVPARAALIVRGRGGFSLLNLIRPGAVRVQGQPVRHRTWLSDGDEVSVLTLCARFRAGLPSRAHVADVRP